MKSKLNINELRASTPNQLVKKYGDGSYFSEDGTPVIIAARNEEKNIAATLASLAENNRIDGALVRPIVVENGSSDKDRTAEIAHDMGATVLHSDPFKLTALQEGVALLREEERLNKPVLFTDADSIVSPTWVNALTTATEGTELAFASGRSTLDNGPSAVSDAVGILALRFEDIARRVGKKAPVGRGDNTALNFANNKETIDWYLEQDPRRFVYEDDAIAQEFLARGARFARVLGQEAAVSSLGDRYESLWERLRILQPGADQWLFEKYEREYPGIIFGKHNQ